MDTWRKNVAVKYSSRNSTALSVTNRRSGNKENRVFIKPTNKQPYIDSSFSRGKRWLPNKGNVARKSITRRLSFPKHDDSISLLNFEEAEKTITTIPGRKDTSNSITSNLRSDRDRNKAEGCPSGRFSHVPQNSFTSVRAPKSELSEETLNYLKKMGLVDSPSSRMKPSSPPKSPVREVSEAHLHDTSDQTLSLRGEEFPNKTETQSGSHVIELENLLSRHSREREELRRRYTKEIEDLEKRHELELKDLLERAKEPKLPEPVAVGPTVTVTNQSCVIQNLNLTQNSYVRTPTSGNWLVSEEFDNISTNNTPTLGLNSMLDDMTLNGNQQFLETPATRRLVTQRILKGMESLFM